jgi:hypothetical protein
MSDAHQSQIDNYIKLMVAITEHIRDCERCHRVYSAAWRVMVETHEKVGIPWIGPNPWKVYEQCSRELHACGHWPAGL